MKYIYETTKEQDKCSHAFPADSDICRKCSLPWVVKRAIEYMEVIYS